MLQYNQWHSKGMAKSALTPRLQNSALKEVFLSYLQKPQFFHYTFRNVYDFDYLYTLRVNLMMNI